MNFQYLQNFLIDVFFLIHHNIHIYKLHQTFKKIKIYTKLYAQKNYTLLLFTADRLHKTLKQKVEKYFEHLLPQKCFSQEEIDSSIHQKFINSST